MRLPTVGRRRTARPDRVNVYEFNRQAITLYEKLGYQTLSRNMRKSLG
jgi:ribosomal protein S18 acetylase RimI-like enzyme